MKSQHSTFTMLAFGVITFIIGTALCVGTLLYNQNHNNALAQSAVRAALVAETRSEKNGALFYAVCSQYREGVQSELERTRALLSIELQFTNLNKSSVDILYHKERVTALSRYNVKLQNQEKSDCAASLLDAYKEAPMLPTAVPEEPGDAP